MRKSIVICCVMAGGLFGSQAAAQGEYVNKGTSGIIGFGAFAVDDEIHSYGAGVGISFKGMTDLALHYASGKSNYADLDEYGVQLSSYIGRAEDRFNAFFAARMAVDRVSSGRRYGLGYYRGGDKTVFTPSFSLIVASNPKARTLAMPSFSVGAQLSTDSDTQYLAQMALGLRFLSRNGSALYLEPGLGTTLNGNEATIFGFLTIGVVAKI